WDRDQGCQRGCGITPQRRKGALRELAAGLTEVASVKAASLQTLGQAHHDRRHTRSRGDTSLTGALRGLEVQLPQIRADDMNIGAAAEIQRLVRVLRALVGEVHLLLELLERLLLHVLEG